MRRWHDTEFKIRAVELAAQKGVSAAAQELKLNESLLRGWRNKIFEVVPQELPLDLKRCTKCDQIRRIEEFVTQGTQLRRHSWCKQCKNATRRLKPEPEEPGTVWRKLREYEDSRTYDLSTATCGLVRTR